MSDTPKWLLYIPDDGHWGLNYQGNNKKEALADARRILKLKRLPNGSGVFQPGK